MATLNSPVAPSLALQLNFTADMVWAVREGRSLTEALLRIPLPLRPGIQALSFLALRGMGPALHALAALARKPPSTKVESLLLVALALLWPQSGRAYPPHTLVDQAVHAAQQRTPGSQGFVNAILRRFLREQDALIHAAQVDLGAVFSHPLWWIRQLQTDWPIHWQALLTQANAHPPMTLRVNARRNHAADYVQRLAEQGRGARVYGELALCSQAVVLDTPCAISHLPGFTQGDVSVQDAAAQRAAHLLLGPTGLPRGARVLDACAAPGGKAAHLLELADLDLLCLDSDTQRLAKVGHTLKRLSLHAELKAADARKVASWWDGRAFDAILLDAPCTASGIVRRHPDVRWLRRPSDLPAMAQTQRELLDALWPLIKPGGRLLYATCSIFKCEGVDQVDAFLQRHGLAAAQLDPASPGHLLALPDNSHSPLEHPPVATEDGFFYALIHKR